MTKKEQLRYLAMLPKVLEALGELADEADGIRALTERIGMRPAETASYQSMPSPRHEPNPRPARTLPAAQRRAIEEGFVPDPGARAARLAQFQHDDEDEDVPATNGRAPVREAITTMSGGDYDPDVDG